MEGGKYENEWRTSFFSLFETNEICLGSTKMEISTGKKAFHTGKKLEKVTLPPPPEKYSSYATAPHPPPNLDEEMTGMLNIINPFSNFCNCPHMLLQAIIVPIFKKKDKMDLANYRGISLLSLAGTVFCTIIQTRIQKKTEETLSESQAGFRAGRSTMDQLFSLRQLAEKFTEIGSPLYCCYIDYLPKGFRYYLARGTLEGHGTS